MKSDVAMCPVCKHTPAHCSCSIFDTINQVWRGVKGTGRAPKRIPKIVELVEKLWVYNPDLRLGQLIHIAIVQHAFVKSIFYIEDDELYLALEKMLAESRSLTAGEIPV